MRYEDYLVQFHDEEVPILRRLCLDTPDHVLENMPDDSEVFYYLDSKETQALLATPPGGVWAVADDEWQVLIEE